MASRSSERVKRLATAASSSDGGSRAGSEPALPPPLPRPSGRVLVVHANGKPYGRGAGGSKASNREFAFSCADYEAMRDAGVPYSGNPATNKLLPLPRPTYTEFINRARRAKCLDRLDFLYCDAECPRPPRIEGSYERVVWCGVSFRRFTRLWTPERSHFFSPAFQQRALAVLCCAAASRELPIASLGALPEELLYDIVARSAGKEDKSKEDYDGLREIRGGARHVFLPAPGSAGLRDTLFDAVFGLDA